jgi:hypothetical protein
LKLSQLIDLEEDEDEVLCCVPSIASGDNAIMKAVVKQCFKGSHYLVKAAFERREPFL